MKKLWRGVCCAMIVSVCGNSFAAEMRAGVAKAVISNEDALVMVNGRLSKGVLEDLHARVLVLNDGGQRYVIVTYDLNCLDVATAILRGRVLDELGIPVENLILLATHNHNAPIQIVPDNFAYGRWLADTIFETIKEAIDAEVGPVKVLFGTGRGKFVINRRGGETDSEIQVLHVKHGDKSLAVFFTHGTHPAQASRELAGSGHPGYAMDEIEAVMPGTLAMYADACGGDQILDRPANFNKKVVAARKKNGSGSADALYQEFARSAGHNLAKVTLRIVKRKMQDVTGPIRSTIEIVSLPLGDPISLEEARKLVEKVPADTGLVPYPESERGTNWVRNLIYWYEQGLPFPKTTTDLVCTDDTYLFDKNDSEMLAKYDYGIHDRFPCVYEEVIVSQIGPLTFIAMQGEVCAGIGLRLKKALRAKGPTFVTSYMGEHNLYIPTRKLVEMGAYEARVIQIQYASPVPWSLDVEDVMVERVLEITDSFVE